MLLSFSVANFRSFREEQTLSMVASNRQPDHPEHLGPIPDDENKVLPVVVLYGANGAGKSNLVKAISCLEGLVIRGTEPKKAIGRRPFLLDSTSAGQPTEFSVQFVEQGTVYALGVKVTDRVVSEEWLSVMRNGREVSVYQRITKDSEEVNIEAGPVLEEDSWGNHAKVLALTKVGVLPNQLFLHAISKALQEQDQGVIAGALRWFTHRLQIIPASASFANLAGLMAQNSKFADFAGGFLRKVATGVDRLKVDTVEVDEKMLVGLGDKVSAVIADLPAGETTIVGALDGTQLIVEKGEGTKVRLRTLQSEHLTAEGARVTLPFSEESDGTQRLTHLLPALHSMQNDASIYIIDEIDRSLHPLLAKGFVRAFLEACAAKGGQLVFTTHEIAFLDLDLLRRDEIWFADKKREEGSTVLYSLSDYKVRTDMKIDKAYLQGRFEAIPPIEAELPDWVLDIIEELHPMKATKEAPPA